MPVFQTVLVVTAGGGGGCCCHLAEREVRDVATHPTMHRTALQNKELSGPKCQPREAKKSWPNRSVLQKV